MIDTMRNAKKALTLNRMLIAGSSMAAILIGSTIVARAQNDPHSRPVKTVEHVDLQRYAGKWYEIARMPNRFQKKCTRNVAAEYTLLANAIEVQNSCVKADGTSTVIRGKAKVTDAVTNAKLKVTFFWPFSGDYWILGIDPNYRWAVVGNASRKYLWILSRTSTMTAGDLEQAMRVAEQNGYSRQSVVHTTQTDR